MADPTLRVKQTLDNSQFQKGLKQSQQMANAFSSSMKAVGGMVAGAFAVGSIINFSKASMDAYAEQIKSEAKLLTALKGRKDVADGLISQANKLQEVTLFGDEEIINGQALLATFTQSEKQLKTLTPLVLDYAQAFGMDVASAAKQVGKALVNTNGAIGKSGIEAEGAAGSYERYSNLVQQLTDKFTGQAEGAIPDALKAQRELTISIDELKEAWGGMVTSIGNMGLFKWISDEFDYLKWGLDKIKEEGGGFKKWWQWFWQTGDFGSDVFEMEKNAEEHAALYAENASKLMQNGTGGKSYGDLVAENLQAQSDLNPVIEKTAEELEKEAKEAEKAAAAFEKLQKEMRSANNESMGRISGGMSPITTEEFTAGNSLTGDQGKILGAFQEVATSRISGMQLMTEDVQELDLALKELPGSYTETVDQMTADSERLKEAFDQIGSSIGTALGEFIKGEATFADVAKGLLQTIIKIVAGYLTESVAASFAGGASSGGPAAPFTGAAAAAAAISMFGALVPALMAEGGTVPGGYPGDTYPALLSSGEMVVPPHKLDSVMGGGQVVVMETQIRGEDIYLIQKKMSSKHQRYS